jgi:hypothetical protein
MPTPLAIVRPRPLPAFALAALAAAAGLSGCSSQDRHEFHSTSLLPTTVSVYDVVHDRTLWSKDIPVQNKLLIDLDRGANNEIFKTDTTPATKMTWWLYPEDKTKDQATASEHVSLPGSQIMLKVAYRPAPEYPPGEGPPQTPPSGTAPATAPPKSPTAPPETPTKTTPNNPPPKTPAPQLEPDQPK